MKNDKTSSIYKMNFSTAEGIDNYNQENIGGKRKKQIKRVLSIIALVIIIVIIAIILGIVLTKKNKTRINRIKFNKSYYTLNPSHIDGIAGKNIT